MPNVIDLLEFLGAPTTILKYVALFFLLWLGYKYLSQFIKNKKIIDVVVIDEIALIYRTPDKRPFPHALFKLKISNLTNETISISDIEFKSDTNLYKKSTPLNRIDNIFIGIPVDDHSRDFNLPSPSCIKITEEFCNNLWLNKKESRTVHVYFYIFPKIPTNETITLLFVINNKKIPKDIKIIQGMKPNAYLG
ncbi:hypothetical protein PT110_05240 [Erysipelothrix rhusiopathiae]|nr:hypothetical protein [Erysipelothrix rhusiopathiae]